jgi:hypothetical protein
MCRAIRWLMPAIATVLLGCQQEKSYLRHPLVREMNITPGPISEPENSTQAEPYPPPRPYLPPAPANVALEQR